MKAVILAGGLGTRLSEETELKPKPMVEIGGKPILWHIMKIYSHYGINEFIICCGYKGYLIKEFFANYFLHTSDVTFDIEKNSIEIHQQSGEPWKVTLVDTGDNTMTGGRLKRIQNYLRDEQVFCMTYGDGLSDINIKSLIEFHTKSRSYATLSAVIPSARFGALELEGDKVLTFKEKPKSESGFVNGGFFVLTPRIFDFLDDDNTIWELTPLENIATEGQLAAYKHYGFWQPMDTLRDKKMLENLWSTGNAPWKVWGSNR